MRVTHVFHSYYPVLGGMERVVQRLAEEQVRRGHEVHVLTSAHGSKSRLCEETINNVHIHRARAIRLHYPDLTYPLNGYECVLEKSDIVHAHSQNSLFNIAITKRAKKIGKPVVMDFLALDYLNSHTNRLIGFFGGRYQERIQGEAVKLADRAVTLNERDHRILREKYGLGSTVVPHGIDEAYLKKPRDDRLFREKHGVHSRNIVAYVGRVHASKGLDTLMKAVSLLEREVEDSIVVIAGSGPRSHVKWLTGLAKRLRVDRKVNLLGYISEAEKISLLDSSKIVVFPTRHFGEAYPLVIDEAYARGVPIVATEVAALPCRVEHMRTGVLVPPDDPLSLAKAMVTLLKNDGLLKRIRGRLRSVKESLLTWREVCRRLEDIYDHMRQSAGQGSSQ